MVPGELQHRRALQPSVSAAAERLFEPVSHLGSSEIAVGWGNDERRARQDPQDFGHPLAGLEKGDAAAGEMGMPREAIAGWGELGIALGSGQAAADGLYPG